MLWRFEVEAAENSGLRLRSIQSWHLGALNWHLAFRAGSWHKLSELALELRLQCIWLPTRLFPLHVATCGCLSARAVRVCVCVRVLSQAIATFPKLALARNFCSNAPAFGEVVCVCVREQRKGEGGCISFSVTHRTCGDKLSKLPHRIIST